MPIQDVIVESLKETDRVIITKNNSIEFKLEIYQKKYNLYFFLKRPILKFLMSFDVGDTILKYEPGNVVGHDFLHSFLDEPDVNVKNNLFIIKRVAYDAGWAYQLGNLDWVSDHSHSIVAGRAVLVEKLNERLKFYWDYRKKNPNILYKNYIT